jgi:peptidoglycan/xylan/chitin deacetylase (PgdA/CDA1 family)
MLRTGVTALLRGTLKTLGRVPPVRQGLHHLSVVGRGAGVAFFRCRRLVPDTAVGRAHPDRLKGSATTTTELGAALEHAKKTVRFVHMGEALAVLQRGERLKESQGLGVLTFDESFATTAELALPVLKAHGVPATIFVTTGPLDDDADTLWDSHVHAVVERLAPRPVAVGFVDRVLPTDTPRARQQTVHRLLLALASLDERELAARLEALFSLVGGRPVVAALDRMLDTSTLAQLCREPLISIGAHGHAHLSLASASDDALLDELARPRERLRVVCGGAFADVVSYPFGRPPYVDERVLKAARHAGYAAGFTALPGVARPGDHLFALPRIAIDRHSTGVHGYELAGTLNALDELMLVASGIKERVDELPEG